MEIERKWLLIGKPQFNFDVRHIVFQSYLVTGDIEVRIREAIKDDSFSESADNPRTYYRMSPRKLTVKSKGGLSRQEVETEISLSQYNELLAMITEPPIIKDYYIGDYCGNKIEVSHVDNEWWYMEVEFASEDAARDFVLPDELKIYVEREVTDDPDYKMQNYWRSTRLGAKK